MTQRWKLTLEYDGRPFCGWQAQENQLTVQGVLQDAITKFCGEQAVLLVSGRTDAGVHALAQVAHVDLERTTSADEIQGALNYHAKPHPVAILKVEEAAPDFHARFNAKQRHYEYRIINRRAPLALEAGRALHVPQPLDVPAMYAAAQHLLGTHDFSTFRAADCQSQSPVKSIDAISVVREGDAVVLRISARSFLYHQVRNIVGSLLLVGSNKWNENDFAHALAAANRTKGGPTAPPDGLYFVKVDY